MFNRTTRARAWLEQYLLDSRESRDLEQFVLIEGKAKGFSEKLLRRAAADCRFELKDGWWAVTELRLEALEIRAQLARGGWRAAPVVRSTARTFEDGDALVEHVDAELQTLAVRVSRRED